MVYIIMCYSYYYYCYCVDIAIILIPRLRLASCEKGLERWDLFYLHEFLECLINSTSSILKYLDKPAISNIILRKIYTGVI